MGISRSDYFGHRPPQNRLWSLLTNFAPNRGAARTMPNSLAFTRNDRNNRTSGTTMTQFDFWRNGVPQSIEVQGNVKLPHHFVKFVSTDDSLFLLDNQKSLWKGDVKTGSILLSKTNIVAVDLARTSAGLYIVSEFGKVYRIDDSLGHQEEVILHEDASNCIHGYATSSHRIHVKQIASNSMEGDSPRLSDTSECSLTNMLPEDKIEYEKEARTGGSMLLINTEAARQFLTRQLSWVSTGGEELLAEVSGPTRIIRRNVSTVASMVYEGVKTVGDKVATLSRHVSGGSDNNSESFEEFEELNNSNASITSSYRNKPATPVHTSEDEEESLESTVAPFSVVCSGAFTCLMKGEPAKEATIESDLAHEQCFLEELITIHNSIVKPLARKSSLDDTISNLCSRYNDVLLITAVIVSALLEGKPSYEIITTSFSHPKQHHSGGKNGFRFSCMFLIRSAVLKTSDSQEMGRKRGRGVMVLDDGTHYDGELREAGVFSGKGTLTFSNGDTFEGTLYGTWADGIKVNGTLQKSMSTFSPRDSFSKPGTFGQLSVGADQKWKSIFRQCYATMGISGENKVNETQKAWENIAAILGTRHGTRHHELLQTIPTYGRGDLDLRSYKQVVAYLQQAVQVKLGDSFIWQMDDLFPVFHYVVVRSHIQELGSEINFIDDFIEERFKNGEMDIMFTTLKVPTWSCCTLRTLYVSDLSPTSGALEWGHAKFSKTGRVSLCWVSPTWERPQATCDTFHRRKVEAVDARKVGAQVALNTSIL
ncbi:unnamed protein product, partial [Nesidiocoris tenuis]